MAALGQWNSAPKVVFCQGWRCRLSVCCAVYVQKVALPGLLGLCCTCADWVRLHKWGPYMYELITKVAPITSLVGVLGLVPVVLPGHCYHCCAAPAITAVLHQCCWMACQRCANALHAVLCQCTCLFMSAVRGSIQTMARSSARIAVEP